MRVPQYLAADFLAAFQRLLPTGPIWPREPDAVLTQTIAALQPIYERQAARSVNLLADAFPVVPDELLPEWEATLGLPDPCAGSSPLLAVRQQQVNARFISNGGQSAAYFTAIAAALGYTITITTYAPFRAGVSTAGQADNSSAWIHTWLVHAPQFSQQFFRAGQATAGQPLASWGNNVLQCELQKLAPAHTVLLFQYS